MSRNISEQIRTLNEELDAIQAIKDQIADRTHYEKDNQLTLAYRAGQLMTINLITEELRLRIYHAKYPHAQ